MSDKLTKILIASVLLLVVVICFGMACFTFTMGFVYGGDILTTKKTPTIEMSITAPQVTAHTAQLQEVVDAFKSAGLEIEAPELMTKENYGMMPMADQGIHFKIPSLATDRNTGFIFYYEDLERAKKSKQFYDELGKDSAMLFSWVFVIDHIMVALDGDLPEAQARQYESALAGMR